MEQLVITIKYFILGLIQGFTEPIPISSSGHVIIGQRLLGLEQRGLTFEILTNTASLFAICFIYRKDIARLFVHSLFFIRTKKEEYKSDFMFVVFIVIGTIPAGVLGVMFGDVIAQFFTSMYTIGFTLIITGVALWLIRNLRGKKREGDLTFKDALLVGVAQAAALIPGISRSGATIITSIAVGMKQDTALRFAFMLYIPVSLGGMVLGISDLVNTPDLSTLAIPYISAFFAALFMTYFAMKWFMGIMARGNLKYFAYYCFVVGTLLIVFNVL
ncbi:MULTISPECIES: undecaprenyl-diphosphate phosphatase [Sutcliffiella]|uniref:undecaprenyl-diphosphate phosphatase n=1 Tax=Sutcliffiella TaxID=2837511 RepID=UPI0022DE270A|nr:MULTISPECIES: undecaprenyl-diphosphate phosphatase [Sutcliffiella]MED4018024.1 undecaprenyl-diphosphate phosphatase [Sutcliffiella cohnii]WBL16480.1 undecaprenyl-diphosphate phosphatase [Sutcliffiella sp. NC1]